MGIFDLFGKKEVPHNASMYNLQCEIHPMKLNAHQIDFVDLEIDITNNIDKELLTSIVISVPKSLGFEGSALSQQREIRLGMLQPHQKHHLKVQVFATQRTEAGRHPIEVYAMSHYRDYTYVINEVRKKIELRVEAAQRRKTEKETA